MKYSDIEKLKTLEENIDLLQHYSKRIQEISDKLGELLIKLEKESKEKDL